MPRAIVMRLTGMPSTNAGCAKHAGRKGTVTTHAEHLELRRRLNDYFPGRTPIDLDRLSKGKLKNIAWHLCSLCVRMQYAEDDGFCSCYTCGKRYPALGGRIHAGHAVHAQGSNSVKFFRRVLRCQCDTCNRWKQGMSAEFIMRLNEEDPGAVEEGLILKKTATEVEVEQYIEMIHEYELELSEYLP